MIRVACYVLGLRDIASKSGKDDLSTFKMILNDIEEVADNSENSISKEILTKITCTLSDKASIQIKFNQLLESYRQEILPDTVDNYESLIES